MKENTPSVFIAAVVNASKVYKKPIYKIEFITDVIALVREDYDRHLKFCEAHQTSSCRFSKYYESVLFFLLDELQVQENKLAPYSFKIAERKIMDAKIHSLLNEFEATGLMTIADFNIFREELEELKKYYFLNKKNWIQLFNGKLLDLISKKCINKKSARLIQKNINSFYLKLL